MWTFFPKTMFHFDESGICGFWLDNIQESKYLWLIWFYCYLWIGKELSTNIYMIERNVHFFFSVIIMVIIMALSKTNIKLICTFCFKLINILNAYVEHFILIGIPLLKNDSVFLFVWPTGHDKLNCVYFSELQIITYFQFFDTVNVGFQC